MTDSPHHRHRTLGLITEGRPKYRWAKLSLSGKVHYVEKVLIRWETSGGTFSKPDVTFLMACGPQRHDILPITDHRMMDRCARCDNRFHALQEPCLFR